MLRTSRTVRSCAHRLMVRRCSSRDPVTCSTRTSPRAPRAAVTWTEPPWTERRLCATVAQRDLTFVALVPASAPTVGWSPCRCSRIPACSGLRCWPRWHDDDGSPSGASRFHPRAASRRALRAVQRGAVPASEPRAPLRAVVAADALQLHGVRDPLSGRRRQALPPCPAPALVHGRVRPERYAVGVAGDTGEHGVSAYHLAGRRRPCLLSKSRGRNGVGAEPRRVGGDGCGEPAARRP